MDKFKKDREKGQALIESVFFFPFVIAVLIAMLFEARWFLIHQKLLQEVREGAFLYSSGHFTASFVSQRLQQNAIHGFPRLDPQYLSIYVGHSRATASWIFDLDEVRLRYKTLEESCTIKHAPSYYDIRELLPL